MADMKVVKDAILDEDGIDSTLRLVGSHPNIPTKALAIVPLLWLFILGREPRIVHTLGVVLSVIFSWRYLTKGLKTVYKSSPNLYSRSTSTKAELEISPTKYTYIYKADHAAKDWEQFARQEVRPLSSVHVSPNNKDRLVRDMKRFLSPAQMRWFKAKQIPYHRGYLFYGPPGTGKSSLALALAGHFDLRVYILSLNDPDLTDSGLRRYLSSTAKPALVLLEDLDSTGIGRTSSTRKTGAIQGALDEEKSKLSKVTLWVLRDVLDGVGAPQGNIVIMSTNTTPKTLDPALIRAGRMDVWQEFKNAASEQLREMLIWFYDDNDHEHGLSVAELLVLADKFAATVPEELMSLAQVQGYFTERLDDPKLAVEDAERWVKEVTEELFPSQEGRFEGWLAGLADRS